MDEKLKHRVVGGIVLLSVALIFIPMLFTTDKTEKTVAMDESTIPANPRADVKTLNTPIVDQWSAKGMADVVPRPIVSGETTLPSHVINPLETPKSSPKQEQAQQVVVQRNEEPPPVVVAQPESKPASRQPVADKPKAVESARVDAKPSVVSVPATGKAWVVQVGSFSDRTNAERLRNKLTRSGYRAFVSQIRSGGQNVVRVRVGPELVKENAEKLSKKLQKELSLQTMVVEHR